MKCMRASMEFVQATVEIFSFKGVIFVILSVCTVVKKSPEPGLKYWASH